MMHSHDVVVAITDSKHKAYREYDFKQNKDFYSTKRATVLLPFDSEYEIMFKNQNASRIKVDIDIDGTNVSDSGIIIDAGHKVYLERFIDVARKFKFVSKDSIEVADPSNTDNGKITIKVQKEACVHHYIPPSVPNIWPSNTDVWWQQSPTSAVKYDSSYSTFSTGVLRSCTKPQDLFSFSCTGEVGATVEGQCSLQKFTTTVWSGSSGPQFAFEFLLRGKTDKTVDPEFEEYMRLKAKFG